MDEKTYEAAVFCTNCGYEGPITAPISKHVSTQPCPVCQLKEVVSAALREWRNQR